MASAKLKRRIFQQIQAYCKEQSTSALVSATDSVQKDDSLRATKGLLDMVLFLSVDNHKRKKPENADFHKAMSKEGLRCFWNNVVCVEFAHRNLSPI